jgi:dolichol-phosphate mannosyltransferase
VRALTILQAASAALVLARLARGRRRRPPLAAGEWPAPHRRPRISVVIPARDEAERIGPCLAGLAEDPDVDEILVVDDRSTDATAEVAAATGARVIDGLEPPEGWVGKPWALQQGLSSAWTPTPGPGPDSSAPSRGRSTTPTWSPARRGSSASGPWSGRSMPRC